mgnify:CR=1 FL=1
MSQDHHLLRMVGIHKSFPGVKALDDVSFDVREGEIHGLLGENGAGKSTLIKILSGAYQPDAGTIEWQESHAQIHNPHHAQQMGIATIYQEFNLIPPLSIAENVFIGREPGRANFINWPALRRETQAVTERLGIHLDPRRTVRSLSVAEQQMVEIAKALSVQSRLIIMDEPTSALTEVEVKQLLNIMRELKAQGLSIIFITHHIEEALAVCDRITVLRDGRLVGTRQPSEVTLDGVIRMMVGRSMDELFKRSTMHSYGDVALRVRGLSRSGTARDPNATVLHDISFEVRKGEILGIAGLVGAGRTELARAIFGVDRYSSGEIEVEGRPVKIRSPRDAIRLGLGLVPEDRKQQALFLALAVRTNMSLAALGRLVRLVDFVSARAERELVATYRQALNISMSSPEQRVANLSGGNQQKVVIARWLALQPRVLIVDEPTRGIDVAAKAEVHQLLDGLAREGIAVVMISSELPEILNMSDRIITIREGRLTGEFSREEATEEKLMHAMALEQDSAFIS